MDKNIILATDFKKAPAEVQAKATAYSDAVKNLLKLEKVIVAKNEELKAANQTLEKAQTEFAVAMKSWNPEV